MTDISRCEQAMKQARWAIALQLGRWRDGDEVCAVAELQNAYGALADIVGDAKMEEPNPPANIRNILESVACREDVEAESAKREGYRICEIAHRQRACAVRAYLKGLST